MPLRRTPLRRGKPSKRKKPLETTKPLPRSGPIRRSSSPKARAKRAEKREEAFGPKADHIRGLPCCACGRHGPSDPHHVQSRGAGGKSECLIPLCRWCHDRGHAIGWRTFGVEVDRDWWALALEYERAWVEIRDG